MIGLLVQVQVDAVFSNATPSASGSSAPLGFMPADAPLLRSTGVPRERAERNPDFPERNRRGGPKTVDRQSALPPRNLQIRPDAGVVAADLRRQAIQARNCHERDQRRDEGVLDQILPRLIVDQVLETHLC